MVHPEGQRQRLPRGWTFYLSGVWPGVPCAHDGVRQWR